MSHDWSKALGIRKDTTPDPGHRVKPEPPKIDPPGWKPNRQDFYEVDYTVPAEHIRSQPLNYESLADKNSIELRMIEANAAADLRRTFDHVGLTLDESTLRPHWQLVVEGYGFRMPEGYIHPEAPPEEQQKARERWKRSVDGAADSVLKKIFLTVWRRRPAVLPPAKPKSIAEQSEDAINAHQLMQGGPRVIFPPRSDEYLRCVPCNTVFPTEADFNRHVDAVHAPDGGEGDEPGFKILGGG